MGLRRTKVDENFIRRFWRLSQIFHSLSVYLPIRVSFIRGYFRRSTSCREIIP
jgi:hypothetical protein